MSMVSTLGMANCYEIVSCLGYIWLLWAFRLWLVRFACTRQPQLSYVAIVRFELARRCSTQRRANSSHTFASDFIRQAKSGQAHSSAVFRLGNQRLLRSLRLRFGRNGGMVRTTQQPTDAQRIAVQLLRTLLPSFCSPSASHYGSLHSGFGLSPVSLCPPLLNATPSRAHILRPSQFFRQKTNFARKNFP